MMISGHKLWRKLFSVSTVSWVTILITLLGFTAFATSSSILLWRSEQSIGIWEAYKTINDEKRRSFTELVKHLGYGGFIHQYKNYVLRKDNQLVGEIDKVLGSAIGAIERYRLTDIDGAESEALDQILHTVSAYGVQLHQIQKLIDDDQQAHLIDDVVRIDDRPALDALLVLKKITANEEGLTPYHTRLDLIGELRFALGFGGMIHSFKNYVLRNDSELVATFNGKINQAHAAIESYRSMPLNAVEIDALLKVEATLDTYQSKFMGMNTRSAHFVFAPELIDEAVRMDDNQALEALDVLDQFAVMHVQREADVLGNDLVTVNKFAAVGLVVAIAMGLLVLAAIYFAMTFFRKNLRARKHLTEELSKSESRLEEAQRIAGVGNFELDVATGENFWSAEMYHIIGLTPDEVTPSYEAFRNFIHPDDLPSIEGGNRNSLSTGEPGDMEFRGIRPDGEVRYFNVNVNVDMAQNGKASRLYGTIQDITEHKKREIELQYTKDRVERLAYRDELTGLSNRTRCQADLAARFSADADPDDFAMIHIDIDNFKRINDTMGHLAGDKMLNEVGRRMRLLTKDSGIAKSYRWGGDEFVIIAEHANNPALVAFCEELTDLISVPIQYGETTMWTSASIGVACYPENGTDLQSLMAHSDLAMYKSKEMGRDRVQFFTDEMRVKLDEETRIEEELRIAVEQDQLFLVFQPQLDVVTRKVKGVEALLRWNHPERGVLAPGVFLDVVENTSLAPQVGRIVIEKALKAARSWLDSGYEFGRIGLNVSPKHLKLGHFLTDLQTEMTRQNVTAEHLAVEVLESIFIDDPDVDNIGVLEQLHKDGVHVQLDDFGTGYASLSHLSMLPVDAIKIDTSFIMHMDEDKRKAVVVKALINLARILNIDAICEGVETLAQLEMLQKIGHCTAQGYYLSRPIPFNDMTNWLQDPSKRLTQATPLEKAS